MKVFYFPPETDDEGQPSKPLCLLYHQMEHVFMSPHRYWKKVKEKYPIGRLVHKDGRPRLDAKGEPLVQYGVHEVWQLDEEKNKELDDGLRFPPDNSLDLSSGMMAELRAQFPHLMSRFKTEDALKREHHIELKKMQDAQTAEIEKERVRLMTQRDRLKELAEKEAVLIAEQQARIQALEAQKAAAASSAVARPARKVVAE